MSVEDWARREAKKRNRSPRLGIAAIHNTAFEAGIVHAFSALLSDKATIAGVRSLDAGGFSITERAFRAALQAAVDAVTEGDTE